MSDSSPQLYPDLAPDLLKRRVAGFVLQNERIVIVQRHHLAMIVQPIAVFAAAFLAAVGMDVFSAPDAGKLRDVFWTVALAAFAFMSWYLSVWLSEFFIVTHKRVMKTTGILNKKVVTLPLGKVVDFTYDQSLLGRIFDYGRFNMESAGDHPLGKINFVSRPMLSYLEISNLLFGPGASAPKTAQEVKVVGVALPNEGAATTEVIVAGSGPREVWQPLSGPLAVQPAGIQDVRLVEEADVRVVRMRLPNDRNAIVEEIRRQEAERRRENARRAQQGLPPLPPPDVTEVTIDGERPYRTM